MVLGAVMIVRLDGGKQLGESYPLLLVLKEERHDVGLLRGM